MTLGDVIRSGLSAFRGRPGGRLWLLRLFELGFGLSALFRMLGQAGPPFRRELLRPAPRWSGTTGSRGHFKQAPPTHIITTDARTALPETARLAPECLRHGAAAVLRRDDHQLSGLMPGNRGPGICSGCFRINRRTSAGVTPSMSTGAGEFGRPSPDGLYRGVGPDHRLVSHGAVTADHR